MSRTILAALAGLIPTLGLAEVPRVVTDIPPVYGLVARVMEGVGEPSLLVRPGASPHSYALKPSEAAALEKADAVVFVGAELTPWLTRPIETLAPKATQLALLGSPGGVALDNRTGTLFGPPADGDHAHDDGHDHEHDHAEGTTDPHAWLDPENGRAWTKSIAALLARLDPEHAAAYQANADAAVAEIDVAEADTRAELAPLTGVRFVGFHDAYQYFENRFGIRAAGSISLSDAAPPGPARIAELRSEVKSAGITCVLAEPQFDPDLVQTVFEGTEVRTAMIDPVGSEIALGPAFYPTLIRKLGASLQACKSGQ